MGAATSAQLGLLFVAVSIRVDTIAKSAELRNRSAQTLTLLLTGLLVAALLAVPDQGKLALGAEYLALALVVTAVALMLDRWAGSPTGSGHRAAAGRDRPNVPHVLTAGHSCGCPHPRSQGRALPPRTRTDRRVGPRSRECVAPSHQTHRLSQAQLADRFGDYRVVFIPDWFSSDSTVVANFGRPW
jgi:hypothetical protein